MQSIPKDKQTDGTQSILTDKLKAAKVLTDRQIVSKVFSQTDRHTDRHTDRRM